MFSLRSPIQTVSGIRPLMAMGFPCASLNRRLLGNRSLRSWGAVLVRNSCLKAVQAAPESTTLLIGMRAPVPSSMSKSARTE